MLALSVNMLYRRSMMSKDRMSTWARKYTLKPTDSVIGVVGLRKRDFGSLENLFQQIGRKLVYLGNIDDGSNMEKNVRARTMNVDIILWNPKYSRHLKPGWNHGKPKLWFRSISEIRKMIERARTV